MKVHCWTQTPYAHLNAMVRVNRNNPALTEAEQAAPFLAAKASGDRVVIIDYVLPGAFDVSDPVKFYGAGPFIADDVAWSRIFFGRLEQLVASIDRLVFDREGNVTLFAVENRHGVAKIPGFIAAMYADPACQGRIPASVTKYAPADFALSSPNRVAAYFAFNQWANDRYYLQAFRDAYVTPARDALGPHVKASEYDSTLVMPGFFDSGSEWPHLSGTVAGTSSPCMYLEKHPNLPTHDARRDYRLARLKSALDAAKKAKQDVVPWISGVSYDVAAASPGSNGADGYVLEPMYGVDYVRRMIDLGVTEFLYWNPPSPYRDANTITRDDAMMALIAEYFR